MIDIATEVAGTLVPVFAVVLLGQQLSRRGIFPTEDLGRLAIAVTSPCFVFDLLARTRLDATQGWTLVAGTLVVLATGFLLARSLLGGPPERRRGATLCATFWNSGNLALSCCALAFGAEGVEAAAVVFVTVLAAQSSMGLWIARGRGGGRALLRAPLFWAAALGLLGRALDVRLPGMVQTPISMVGAITIPLMLLTLGGQLRRLRIERPAESLRVVALRLGAGVGGTLLFLAICTLIGAPLEGVPLRVLWVNALMPSAVLNVVISQRYGADPALAASVTVLGTLLSAALLPVLLAFLAAGAA